MKSFVVEYGRCSLGRYFSECNLHKSRLESLLMILDSTLRFWWEGLRVPIIETCGLIKHSPHKDYPVQVLIGTHQDVPSYGVKSSGPQGLTPGFEVKERRKLSSTS